MATTARPSLPGAKATPQGLADRVEAMESAVVGMERLGAALTPSALRRSTRDTRRALAAVERASASLASLRAQLAAALPPAVAASVGETFNRLMADGQIVDSAEFQRRAGITRQALSKAVAARRLFYLEFGGRRGYPAFFLDPGFNRADLETVSKLLGDVGGGTKFGFFVTPRGSLATAGRIVDGVLTENGTPRTPLRAMRDGEFERVKAAATATGGR
jgi:hypothetical protein